MHERYAQMCAHVMHDRYACLIIRRHVNDVIAIRIQAIAIRVQAYIKG